MNNSLLKSEDTTRYTIGSTELKRIILSKMDEFENKFGVSAKYIKVPVWIYKCMQTMNKFEIFTGINYSEFFLGLQVCPTISIQLPEDIEVF